MKTITMYYANKPNMGDQLNRLIVEKCWGLSVRRRTYLTGSVSGIGSGLGNLTYSDNKFKASVEFVTGFIFPRVTVWGTGFINYRKFDNPFFRKHITFAAVRGELSKRRVQRILGRDIDIPTGDAGILASTLLSERPKKKYSVGIIAHYKEQDEPIFGKLLDHYPNSKYIDLRDDPLKVVIEIAECDVIISSSLHGLIVADSFNIPNIHLVVSNNLLGDGFKFDDYYSAYGMEHVSYNVSEFNFMSVDLIKRNYKLSKSEIDIKKRELLECFPATEEVLV